MIDENLKQLYLDLQRLYDLVLDRRKNLTNQATNLMSFTGVINTVLIGVIVAITINKDAQILILSSSFYPLFLSLGSIGFLFYIATSFFSLLAFREPKWYRLPEMPNKDPISSITDFFDKPNSYSLKQFAFQLTNATIAHQKTNDRKYMYLKIATICLMIGIGATIITGILMIFTPGRTSDLTVITKMDSSLQNSTGYTISDFIIHLNGNNPSLTEFPGSNKGVNISLRTGPYSVTVSTSADINYSTTYSSECTGYMYDGQNRRCEVSILTRD